MGVKVYYSSVSSNLELKKRQQRIFMVLDGKCEYEKVDIAACEEAKQLMRDLIGKSSALPPQIFNDNVYCGDFEAFDNAIEDECLEEFLKI